MSNLKGKVALVTGGTGGIGAAICLKLAESGAKVATNYRNEEKAKAWQADVKKAGHDIAVYQADVSDFDACQALTDQIEKDLGPIDILVNNAGITKDGMFKKMSKAGNAHVLVDTTYIDVGVKRQQRGIVAFDQNNGQTIFQSELGYLLLKSVQVLRNQGGGRETQEKRQHSQRHAFHWISFREG